MSYVILAWAVSWAFWIPMALRGEVVTPGATTGVSHFPGLLGPMVAALVVTVIVGGKPGIADFAARWVRWRVPARWYLAAVLPILIFFAVAGLLAATGGPAPDLADLGEFSGLPDLAWPLLVVVVLLFNGYGEEAGWRGFLVPGLLQRRGPFATSLIVAAVWFAWHVPSFPVIEGYRIAGLGIVPMMGLGLVAGSMILTWLYVGSGGSIWIVALWHLTYNFASATTAGRGAVGMLVYTAIVIWALAVGIGWLVAEEPRTRPLATRLRDGFLIALLRSPLGRWIHGMTVITFTARRTGRILRTPVECVAEAGQLFVLVGNPESKQWWRNVMNHPDVLVEVDGRDVPGRATVHAGADPTAGRDLGVYLEHRPRAARMLGVLSRGADPAELQRAAERAVTVRIDLMGAAAG
ncbi:MAG TPA: nitroreductase/quinone reductase family protein [Candidatus Limnocylindrales bacterium]|nr:nitroreductase/quinone reductase family protein [Candidatus Limnocylindrales bacterium]